MCIYIQLTQNGGFVKDALKLSLFMSIRTGKGGVDFVSIYVMTVWILKNILKKYK
jgi:hypothetical protein